MGLEHWTGKAYRAPLTVALPVACAVVLVGEAVALGRVGDGEAFGFVLDGRTLGLGEADDVVASGDAADDDGDPLGAAPVAPEEQPATTSIAVPVRAASHGRRLRRRRWLRSTAPTV